LRPMLVARKPRRDAAIRAQDICGSKRVHSANVADVQSVE
jgi:hypothetical protein